MANNKNKEKQNRYKEKLVKDRDKQLQKAAKRGRYNKYEKKLLAAKKIGIFLPVEGRYSGKSSKTTAMIHTLLMALLLATGLCSAYIGMCEILDVYIREVVLIFGITFVTVGVAFCKDYCGKKIINGTYIIVGAIMGLAIYLQRNELIKDIFVFGEKYVEQYLKYTGNDSGGYSGSKDVTTLFLVLGVVSALLIVATTKSTAGTTIFVSLTLPCVISCMLVGTMPEFFWFVVYGMCFVGISCANGIVGYREYGKATGYIKKEAKALKGEYKGIEKEQAATVAYVKIVLTAMVASLAVILTMALVYPKRDYEKKKAGEIRIDLENKLVDMEDVINKALEIDLGISDKLRENHYVDVEGSGELPDIFFDIDKLMKRVKDGGGIGFGVIPEGKINLDAKDRRLEVTVGKLEGNLYLKGYVADVYEDGRWVFSGNSLYDKTYAVDFFNSREVFDFYVSQQTINIDNVGDKTGVDFIPYFIKESAYDYQYNTKGGVTSHYANHGYFTRYDVSLDDITSTSFSIKDSDWESVCESEGEFIGDEEFMVFNHQLLDDSFSDDYRKALVEEWISLGKVSRIKNDIIISNELAINLESYDIKHSEFTKSAINEKIVSNVKFVQNYLSNNMTYTLSPPKNNTGLDSASFFLKESKQGYCMHFATSGALLLAQMGVPVRYAEGYVVTEDNYKVAVESDIYGQAITARGDYSSDVQNISNDMYTVPVYGANAHAWVEVYLMGIGWVPVEMTRVSATGEGFESVITQAFEGASPTKKPENTKSPEESEKPQESKRPGETKEPEKTKEPNKTPAPTDAAKNLDDDKPKEIKLSPVVVGIILGCVGLIVLITAYIVYRKARLSRIKALLKTRRGTLKYIFATIERLSGKKGIVYANDIRYDEYGRLLSGLYECLEEDMAIEYMTIISKELFSREGISEEEFEKVKEVYIAIVNEIFTKSNKLYLTYLKNILLVQDVLE